MARRSTLDNILEAVSADNSLREALLGRLMSGANEDGSFSSQHVSRADHPPRTTSQSLPCFPAFGTQMCQSGLNSPAVTQMCQPGRVTPLVTARKCANWEVPVPRWSRKRASREV